MLKPVRHFLLLSVLCLLSSFSFGAVVTQTFTVAAEADDGISTAAGLQSISDAHLAIGDNRTYALPYPMSAMRFANIDIPRNATIISANLKIRSLDSEYRGNVEGVIRAEAVDHAPDYTIRNISDAPLTAAAVDWDHKTNWLTNTWYTSPDIKPLIQQAIDRPNWRTSNAVALYYSTRTETGKQRFFAAHSTAPAQLEITCEYHTISGTVTTAAGSPLQDAQITAGPDIELATTDASGYYELKVPPAWTGILTVARDGWGFTQWSHKYIDVTIDQINQNFTAFQPTISGSTAVSGATVTISGVGSATSTPNYTITVPYGWTGSVSAELAGYHFADSPKTYTNVTSNKIEQHFTPYQPTISGTTNVAGATVTISGVGTVTSTPAYGVVVPYGWTGTVSASLMGYHFADSPRSFTNVTSSKTGQDFTPYQPTISGDAGVSGALISVSGVGITASSPSYSIAVPYGWSGTVEVSRPNYNFPDSPKSYTNIIEDQVNQDFTAYQPTISGYVKTDDGVGVANVTVTAVSGGFSVTDPNGFYEVTVPYNWSGIVKAKKLTWDISPESLGFSNLVSDQTGPEFTAVYTGVISVNANGTGDVPTILDAVNAASDGDIVALADGTYTGYGNRDIRFNGKAITVRGNMSDPNLVVIDCQGTSVNSHRAFRFFDGEGSESVIEVFTITNGYAPRDCTINGISAVLGGGVLCIYNSGPTIRNCNINGNSAQHGGGVFGSKGLISDCVISSNSSTYGGGMNDCDGTIRNCLVSDNTANDMGGGFYGCDGLIESCQVRDNSSLNPSVGYGGGLYYCKGTIRQCDIAGNSAQRGGGLYACHGEVLSCSVSNNTSDRNGGGFYGCRATIRNCTISGNSASKGGGLSDCYSTIEGSEIVGNSSDYCGGGLQSCNKVVRNCIVKGNSATSGGGIFECYGTIEGSIISGNSAKTGGGLYGCDGNILNCTIAGNSATSYAGGMYDCDGQIKSCIVWGNATGQYGQMYSCSPAVYSCIEDWNGTGTGNIIDDPLFVDADSGDYHLRLESCCINSGDIGNVYGPNDVDIDGDYRLVGRVDIGADEFFSTEPILRLSEDEFSFSAYDNYQNPSAESFNISNLGEVESDWTITGGQSWLSISDSSGVLGMGEQVDVDLNVDISSLAAGNYSCQLELTGDGAVNSPLVIDINLEVLQVKVSGVISKGGEVLAGVDLSADNGGGVGVSDPNGYYEIVVPYGWSGTVTPDTSQWPEWHVSSQSYTDVTGNVAGQDYSLWQPVIHLSFENSGISIGGVEVSVTDFNNPILVDGSYDLVVPFGWSGTIAPVKDKTEFEPAVLSFDNVTVRDVDAFFTGTCLYGGGSGSLDDPYKIWTASDLYKLSVLSFDWDKHFILMADLDLDTAGAIQPVGPIGNNSTYFTGSFDGNGHTISNLKITVADNEPAGLFGHVRFDYKYYPRSPDELFICDLGLISPQILRLTEDYYSGAGALAGCFCGGHNDERPVDNGLPLSLIKNCYVVGGFVQGQERVGGLIGYIDGCEISECYAVTAVSGTNAVGGLIGKGQATVLIDQCFSDCTVTGITDVGGFVGRRKIYRGLGIISNCYSLSTVSGENGVGGFIGAPDLHYLDSSIIFCYAAGAVSGSTEDVGGFAGTPSNYMISGSNKSCYWDTETSGQSESVFGIGRTTAQMKSMDTYEGWGSTGAWVIDEGVDYPRLAWENTKGQTLHAETYSGGRGTKSDPYLISTARELNAIGRNYYHLDKSFKLIADIDMSELTEGQFEPIGTAFSFTGEFDGNGHSISKLNYVSPAEIIGSHYAGLFGFVGDKYYHSSPQERPITTEIHDFTLIDPNMVVDAQVTQGVQGSGVYCGSLAGRAGYDVGIKNVKVINANILSNNGGSAGMLLGQNYGVIFDCTVNGSVVGGYNVGGLVGSNGGVLSQCSAEGSIVGEYDVGGLVGYNQGNINRSSVKGSVTGTGYVGGLAGKSKNSLAINNCYSQCDVQGVSSVGGFVGEIYLGVVNNCYSAGLVTGTDTTGAFVGEHYLGYRNKYPSTFNGCFWDKDLDPNMVAFGNNSVGGVAGLPTDDLQSTGPYLGYGWDFMPEETNGTQNIWRLCEGMNQYPSLMWEYLPGDYLCPDGVSYEDIGFLAEHWLDTDYGDVEGAEFSGDGFVGIDDLAAIAEYWLVVDCGNCNGRDLTGDGNVDLADLAYISARWNMTEFGNCNGVDLTGDGEVNLKDFAVFAQNWLRGGIP